MQIISNSVMSVTKPQWRRCLGPKSREPKQTLDPLLVTTARVLFEIGPSTWLVGGRGSAPLQADKGSVAMSPAAPFLSSGQRAFRTSR